MSEERKWDRKIFNTDPKHEAERTQFDEMLEDAFNRIEEKKRLANPPPVEPENFFDKLFGRK